MRTESGGRSRPTSGELAAITIQKIWRGHLGRKAACWKMYDNDVIAFNARMAAATTIQKIWRGCLGRILPPHRMRRIDELYETRAAIYIQRVWRGFSSRGIVALKDPDMFYESQHLYSWKDDDNSPEDFHSIVRFINTGVDEYKWEKIDGCGAPLYEDDGIVEAHTFTPTCVTKIQLMRGVGHCVDPNNPFIVTDGIVVKATNCVKLTNSKLVDTNTFASHTQHMGHLMRMGTECATMM